MRCFLFMNCGNKFDPIIETSKKWWAKSELNYFQWMKTTLLILRILIGLFLAIAVAVHIAGLFMHVSDENILSHIIHIISYSLCLFMFLRSVKYRLVLYAIGAIYPFCYHANCFFTHLLQQQKFNSICFEVIVVLPLAALIIWQQETENKKRSA